MTTQAEPLQDNGLALRLNDLALMANIIQVTSERGAIKANEMEAVGALYRKIVTFVNSNVPAESKENNETQSNEDNQ